VSCRFVIRYSEQSSAATARLISRPPDIDAAAGWLLDQIMCVAAAAQSYEHADKVQKKNYDFGSAHAACSSRQPEVLLAYGHSTVTSVRSFMRHTFGDVSKGILVTPQ
jgi:hypothetical protein